MTASALAPEQVWALLLALRRHIRESATIPARLGLGLDPGKQPTVTPAADPAALIEITSDGTWTARLPLADAGAELLDLYLPLALARRERPLTVAHLGQSLDGRIATANGASCYVTGPENLTHLHRMRALCDAIVVGAGTVECDDPQLTTRRVPGSQPGAGDSRPPPPACRRAWPVPRPGRANPAGLRRRDGLICPRRVRRNSLAYRWKARG